MDAPWVNEEKPKQRNHLCEELQKRQKLDRKLEKKNYKRKENLLDASFSGMHPILVPNMN